MKDPIIQTLGTYSTREASKAPATSHIPPKAKQQASGPSAWKRITTFYKNPASKTNIQPMQIRYGEFAYILRTAKLKACHTTLNLQ